jgi:hypothetical protein
VWYVSVITTLQEGEAGRLRILGQIGLHSQKLSQKTKKNKKENVSDMYLFFFSLQKNQPNYVKMKFSQIRTCLNYTRRE